MKGKGLTIGIVLLLLTLSVPVTGMSLKEQTSSFMTDQFQLVRWNKMEQEYVGPAFFGFNWVIYLDLINNGNTVSNLDVQGDIYRIRNHRDIGGGGYVSHWYEGWEKGEVRTVKTIIYFGYESVIPGICHIYIRVGEFLTEPSIVINGTYFVFWNYIVRLK